MGEQMGSRTTSGAIVEAVAVFDGVATTDVGNCLGSVERPPGERREFVRRGCREDAPAVVGGESAKLVNERAKPHGQGFALAFAAAVHRVEGITGTDLSGGTSRLGGKGPGRAPSARTPRDAGYTMNTDVAAASGVEVPGHAGTRVRRDS